MIPAPRTPTITLTRLSQATRADFDATHAGSDGPGWCQCVAWHVPDWNGWGARTREENLALREKLTKEGVADGYLIHADGVLAGWVQADERDRFSKLQTQFDLAPAPGTYMIGCFVILPAFRRRGMARAALAALIPELKSRGARAIEAFPKRTAKDEGEFWNGPESIYADAGFAVVRDDPVRPVLRIQVG